MSMKTHLMSLYFIW